MPIQIQGNAGTVAEVDGTAFRAIRATLRPLDYGALGHYRVSAVSGILAATLAANAQVFQFKWTDATRLAVVTYARLQFQTLTLFTAAQQVDFGFDMFKVTSFAAGGGGTTVGAPSKMRTSMGASLVGGINISTTGLLTAATTLDAVAVSQSLGDVQRMNPAAATEEQRINDPTLVFAADPGRGEHPLVLTTNEGFVLRNRTVWPAAGTGMVQVEVAWSEVTAY